jgi:hypothetical protein
VLEPNDRRHLLESLRPPEGYGLTHALGTTYSLDLLSLLTVPLAFSLFDWEAQDGSLTKDPLAVLESLRRHAEHVLLFCQAGAIHVPDNAPLLLASLEPSVVEVQAPREVGVFHPKVWFLRFVSPTGPILYRFICASRNLTFDRSWDTVLVLEGELEDRQVGFGGNRPLADFIQALPALAPHGIPEARLDIVRTMEREIRKVRFAPPAGFDEIAFCPLGIDGHRSSPLPRSVQKLLVVSPFLSADVLQLLAGSAQEAALVSRLEALQALSRKQLAGFSHLYTLAAEADPEPEAEDAAEPTPDSPAAGLHAKLYIADLGWDSKVWTGSANATAAAFRDNVEFLVELTGRRSVVGVDSLLEPASGKMKLADLLEKYVPEKEALAPDPAQAAMEQGIEQTKRHIVASRIRAHVAGGGADDAYTVILHSDAGAGELATDPAMKVKVHCWPITQLEERAAALEGLVGEVAVFENQSFPSLTAFFAFRVDIARGSKKLSSRFVLNLPLVGVPVDRQERLLRHLLRDRGQVLRLLLLILADVEGAELGEADVRRLLVDAEPSTGFLYSAALLEPLLRALARDPQRLDEVARLVDDLGRTTEGQALLPEGFHRVWDPIWTVREARRE